MDINKQNLSALYTAVKTAFRQGQTGYKPFWPQLATMVPSTTSAEDYSWLGQFPKLREWIGDREVKKMENFGYTLKNKKFESTVGIPSDAIEDDQYGVFMPLYEEMGYAAITHPDELLFPLLAAGFTTQCYDGQNFFDTDHPVGDNSVSNMQAGGGSPWFVLDTNRPLKPFIYQKRKDYGIKAKTDAGTSDHVFMTDEYVYGVDGRGNVGFGFWQQAFASKATLDDTNLDAAIAAMMSLKSPEGRPLGIIPKLLVCGPSNRAAAKKVLEAENKANGESNTNFKALELLVVPWLA